MADRVLRVVMVGDERDLERSFTRASRSAKEFDRNVSGSTRGALAASGAFKNMGRSIAFASAPFLGGAGLIAGVKTAVAAASDLNEQTSKTNVVFDKSAANIKAWSKTTSEAFGLSQREALGVASTFGALFRPIGLTGQQAAVQSKQLTQLGADLASFYNTDVADALDAIRSGIVGESEPLRRYGVLLSESRVQAQALADTHKHTVKELTNQEKALARIKIILQDSTVAQGDFERTSEGLANQQRILKANFDDLATTIGGVLIPQVVQLTQKFNDLFAAMDSKKPRDFFKVFKDNAGLLENVPNIGPFAHAIDLINNKLEDEAAAAKKASDALKEIGAHGTPRGTAAEETGHIRRAAEEVAKATRKGITAAQRNTFFDNLIGRREDRVQDIQSLRGQVSELDKIIDMIQAQIRKVSDPTRKLALGDEVVRLQRQRRDVLQTIRDDAKQAAADAKATAKQAAEAAAEARRKAREAFIERRNERQFDLLGLGPTGGEKVPGLRALRKVLANVQDEIRGSVENTAKNKAKLTNIFKVLFDPKGVSEDVRSSVQKILGDLDRQLKQHQTRVGQQRRHADTSALLAGLGLSPEQLREARFRLSRISPGGTIGGHTGSFALAGGGTTVVMHNPQFNGVTDINALEEKLRRRNLQRARSRRGPYAGRN